MTSNNFSFPCRQVPEDPHVARLMGLYSQRQEGQWMQRLKVLGGHLTGQQWRGLADIVRQFTPDCPLHLTTRQDIELHTLTDDRIPGVQHRIAEMGLTCLGACGDTLRNITVCPCAGVQPGRADLIPLAWAIRKHLEATDGIFDLPRKFKIALACGDDCGQPWINDIGFVARQRDRQWGFRVMVAGSLGAKPGLGMLLADWLPAGEVLPLVTAAIRVFAAHGDRDNRRRARLRHVRERIGDEAFTTMLQAAFDEALAEQSWPAPPLEEPTRGLAERLTLTFPNGDITPDAAEALGRLAERDDTAVRIANHHRVIVFGRELAQLADAVSEFDALSAAAKPQPNVVACPGQRWCSRGLVHTNAMADRIRAELPDLAPDTFVGVSGCPNGCGHSAVADIGLSGVLVHRGGEKQEAYNLLAGGGMGRRAKLAQPVAQKLLPDQVLQQIRRLDLKALQEARSDRPTRRRRDM